MTLSSEKRSAELPWGSPAVKDDEKYNDHLSRRIDPRETGARRHMHMFRNMRIRLSIMATAFLTAILLPGMCAGQVAVIMTQPGGVVKHKLA